MDVISLVHNYMGTNREYIAGRARRIRHNDSLAFIILDGYPRSFFRILRFHDDFI